MHHIQLDQDKYILSHNCELVSLLQLRDLHFSLYFKTFYDVGSLVVQSLEGVGRFSYISFFQTFTRVELKPFGLH